MFNKPHQKITTQPRSRQHPLRSLEVAFNFKQKNMQTDMEMLKAQLLQSLWLSLMDDIYL